ncbi:MAG: Kelch repeat-containing protein [Limisphaerales bacterium]
MNGTNAIYTAGNLGLGVAHPAQALDVAGNIQWSGVLLGNGSGLTHLPEHAVEAALPSGTMVVSMLATDSALLARGYRLTTTVPAPAWMNGPSPEVLAARFEHTAIWDGQRMLVWGGKLAAGAYSANGAMYQPDTDSWTLLSTIGTPTARGGHRAVWTGSEMIVWGGWDATGYLGHGGRFTPPSQTWLPMSTSGAPAGRHGHVALWTGHRLLIWGGRNASGLLADGALYDPVLDQWTALNLPGAPESRLGAAAVWTGDRLLLWGGTGVGGELHTGAQLLFADGAPTAWGPLSTLGAPSERAGHTAVWADTRMIVWGGSGGGVPRADGAAYDPVTDLWEHLSSTNAPSARFNHATAWTGTEMLILGGTGATGDLASGAAYDPATGLWRVLSGAGSPLPRGELTAVWTDSEVLVFGGRSNGTPVNSLQRLVPQPAWFLYRKL